MQIGRYLGNEAKAYKSHTFREIVCVVFCARFLELPQISVIVLDGESRSSSKRKLRNTNYDYVACLIAVIIVM